MEKPALVKLVQFSFRKSVLLFHLIFSLILCLFLPACASQIKSNDQFPFPIIDAHVHTDFENRGQGKTTEEREENFLKEMKAAGVVGAVALTRPDGSGYFDLRNSHVVSCAGVPPEGDLTRIEEGLKSGQYGCLKIYLGYVYQYAYDPKYEPAYQLAEKYHVPVVFHTGDTNSTKGKLKYSDPLTIDEVAVDHPNVKFVIAHCGNPWIESAAEVAYKNPNVYLDGSAFLIGDISHLSEQELDEYVTKPVRWILGYVEDIHKLMYGSDWPLIKMTPYIEAFSRAVPKKYWKQVFYENALWVFNIPGLEPSKSNESPHLKVSDVYQVSSQ